MNDTNNNDNGTLQDVEPVQEQVPQVTMAVDETRCIGAGQCEMLAPDSFRVDDDSALASWVGPDSLPTTEAETLIDRCPSGALSIVKGPIVDPKTPARRDATPEA